ncbi:ABC transporter permease [Mycolicibacterium sp. XJ1819]
MSSSIVGKPATRLRNGWAAFVSTWNQLGVQTAFFMRVTGLIAHAVSRHTGEVVRVMAQMSLGVGTLAVIGGSIVIVTFLVMTASLAVSAFGHAALSYIGVDALGGFVSAYVVTRIGGPLITAFALAATIGAGATAQLGAMRIAEEIDALEVMGIRTISYLASTRVVAGVIVTIPLFCLSMEVGYLGFRFAYTLGYGRSAGTFAHYFDTYLNPTDVMTSLVQAMVTAFLVMLVHTYYGFNATGGPAGVGEAVGRAVRASLSVAVAATLVIAMTVYGITGDFNLSG